MFKKNKEGEVFKIHRTIPGYVQGFLVLGADMSTAGTFEDLPTEAVKYEDVPYDSERGLYDGQPIYMYPEDNPNHSNRMIKFFNVDDNYSQTIEPIPIETLKTMPFIWNMYKQLKD